MPVALPPVCRATATAALAQPPADSVVRDALVRALAATVVAELRALRPQPLARGPVMGGIGAGGWTLVHADPYIFYDPPPPGAGPTRPCRA